MQSALTAPEISSHTSQSDKRAGKYLTFLLGKEEFFGVQVAADYILGMAKARGKVKILLDIDAVLTSQEIHGLEAVIG